MDIVYLITDTITNLKYLGSKKNWKGENTYWGSPNCKNKRYKKYELQQEWKRNLKSRLDTFKFEVIDSYEKISHKELLEIELYYQYKLDVVKSMEFVNAGFAKKGFCGDTMSILTEEGRKERIEKITNGLKETISKLTDEERHTKYARYEDKNGMYGKKHSEESKKKMSVKQKINGEKYSLNRKGKSYTDVYGKERADEIKHKLSDSQKMRTGEKNSFFGKHHSEKTKQILSEKRKGIKPVNMKKVQIGDKEFESLASASIETGIKYTTLWHRIKSNNQKYKNYQYI